MQNSRINRFRTVLSVLLLVITIFSFTYVTVETGHHCSNEHCTTCYLIQSAKTTIEILILSLLFAGIVLHNKKTETTIQVHIKSIQFLNTLFLQKTRLND